MSTPQHQDGPSATPEPAPAVTVDRAVPAEEPPPSAEAGADPAAAGEEPCAEYPLPARIEALLASSERPLSDGRLVELLGLAGPAATKRIGAAIDSLNAERRAYSVQRLAGGWQMLTRPEFGPLLIRLHRDRQHAKLSPAALETLAIVAYRQPIIRAEIEAIRGVSGGEVLRGLLERRLVKIAGRAEELGRPMLYGTTREFLKVFGLASLDDLAAVEGLELPSAPPPAAPGAEPPDTAATAAPETASETGTEAGSRHPSGS